MSFEVEVYCDHCDGPCHVATVRDNGIVVANYLVCQDCGKEFPLFPASDEEPDTEQPYVCHRCGEPLDASGECYNTTCTENPYFCEDDDEVTS